ncbi:MAG: VUT family protein [Opitutales bacterium]|nr:VUT family protein [Opitutales bacterium]
MKAALIYIAAVLLGNLTATAFIPFPVFGQVAVGTLIFGITFTQRDRMHNAGGRRFVYKVIGVTALLTLALLTSAAYGWGMPLTEWFRAQGWNWLADSTVSLAESGPRVFVASMLAIVIAEAADTEIYHRLRKRSWAMRVLSSNSVSVPMDSVLFNIVAFAGIFEPMLLAQIIFGEIVIKYTISAIYAAVPREAELPAVKEAA